MGSPLLTFHFFLDKQENLFEMLELESPYVSSIQIERGYDKAVEKVKRETPDDLEKLKMMKKAFMCLKKPTCRD